MNERIKELAEQARQHFPKTETSGEFWVFDEQKFAKLIVEECTTVIDRNLFQNIGWNTSRAVRRHFGIDQVDE